MVSKKPSSTLSEAIDGNNKSYHLLIRECTRVIQDTYGGRDWKEWDNVTRAMESEGFTRVDKYRTDKYRRFAKKDVFLAQDRHNLDLFVEFSVDLKTSKTEPTKRVINIHEIGLEAKIDAPYRTVLQEEWYGKGTAIQAALAHEEVKEALPSYPIIDNIEIGYSLIGDRWQEYNPRGFSLSVKLLKQVNDDSAGKSVHITIASDLDPLESWSGEKLLDGFVQKDTLGEIRSWGGSEWKRDDSQKSIRRKENARAEKTEEEQPVSIAYSLGDLKTLPTDITRLELKEDWVKDQDMQLLSRFTSLKVLDLGDCDSITDKGLSHLTALSKLISLTLSGKRISRDGLQYLVNLPQLTDLSIYWCSAFSRKEYQEIARLKSLTHLSLWWSGGLTDADLADLSNLSSLEDLSLWGTGDITDLGLAHISSLSKLKELSFSHSAHITLVGIEHLTKLKHLRDVTLGYMPLGDEALAHLGRIATLEQVTLHGLKITDVGLECLRGLKNLKYFYINDCNGVTEEGLQKMEKVVNPSPVPAETDKDGR